jgi:crotonobetainyl-CoA:carnitine CoA-transferase CaiB-like acyl-CoA transferase
MNMFISNFVTPGRIGIRRPTAWRQFVHRSETNIAKAPILNGLTVLELSSVLAGPSVSQFLSELGAFVVKIENKQTRGDVTRTWKLKTETNAGGNNNHDDRTAYFHCCNSGKQSIAVDVTKMAGLDIVHRLVERSDIVVASYKPGDAEKLQLDYNTLRELNPSLIYACISGYGQDDSRAGYDAVIQAEAGFQYMNGSPESLPCKMPVALMDVLAAHHLKEGILVSLLHRERTGEGSFVQVSLIKAAVSSLANQATGYLMANSIPERQGSEHPSICPYGTVFQTGDGRFVVFAVGTDSQFVRLCKILDCQEMTVDERFQTNACRVNNREECTSWLQEKVAEFQDRDELLNRLVSVKVPAAGVNAMDEVFAMPQARDVVLSDSVLRKPSGLRQVAFDMSFMQQLPNMTVPPHYGQHCESVLKNTLGLTSKEVNKLILDGVIDTY